MSRILRRLARAAAAGRGGHAARPAAPRRPRPWPGQDPDRVGVCWTSRDVRVDAERLMAGEYIAADVALEPAPAGPDGPADAACRFYWAGAIAISERVTRDARDLGWVTQAGVSVGRVVSIRGDQVDWELL